MIIDETGSNTGVFESSDGNDLSEISVKMGADDGNTFTIAYADDSQQVIVDSFDSTLELVADGTWNSGDTLTVRLTNENLNINTLADDDMKIDDPALPVMTFGAPTTVSAFKLTSDNPRDSITEDGTDTGTVTLTASLTETTFTTTLQEDFLAVFQNPNLFHYINYYPDPNGVVDNIATDAELIVNNENVTGIADIESGLTRVQAQTQADGEFSITFTTNINSTTNAANNVLNTAYNAIDAEALTAAFTYCR